MADISPISCPTAKEIDLLLNSIDRYNKTELDKLITYFQKSTIENTSNLEVCLAILKLYQFFPEKADLATTKSILLKCLCYLPSNDFTACLYLLTEKDLQDPGMVQLKEMNRLLESCLFSEFWSFLTMNSDIVNITVKIAGKSYSSELVGFSDHIRKYIVHIVILTYQVCLFILQFL